MSEQTKKMRFTSDKMYNFDIKYKKDVVYDVPVAEVDRWLKRGGILVEDVEQPPEVIQDETLTPPSTDKPTEVEETDADILGGDDEDEEQLETVTKKEDDSSNVTKPSNSKPASKSGAGKNTGRRN